MLFWLFPRCINADPNYGSNWFHCRHHPHDNPMWVLQRAVTALQHELLDTHRVYARAIMHWVRRCISESVLSDVEEAPEGTAAVALQEKIPAERDNANEALSVAATAGSAVWSPAARTGYSHQDLLTDMTQAQALLQQHYPSAPKTVLLPFIKVKPSGSLYAYEDFVTALVRMNREIFTRNIPDHVLRANIYGSDQIIS